MTRALKWAGRTGIVLAAAGGVVGLAATPALAASGTLNVSPTGTLDHNAVIKASANYNNNTASSQTLQLTVTRPDSSSQVLYKGTASALSTGSTPTASVDTSALNVNGSYVFNFAIGGTSATPVTVTLKVRPAKVSGFSAGASSTVAHFSWSPNSEPDLAGYDLIDVTDAQNPRDLTPGGVGTDVCDAGGCAVDIDFGSAAQGTSRTFVVDALRYTSPSHSSTIASDDSSPATVDFPAPAPAQSSDPGAGGTDSGSGGTGTTGGSGSGGSGSTGGGSGSGGSTTGGSTAGGHSTGTSRQGISSNHPSAALKAYLPSISAAAAPDLPSVVTEVKPLPEGTYKPTLAYPDQVVTQAQSSHGQPIAQVRDEIVRVLNVSAVWKSLAGAALVLLVAAHLRAWVARLDQEA